MAIVINSLDSGGTEGHLLSVLPRLDPTRFAPSVFPLRAGGLLTSVFVERGVRVVQGNHGRMSSLGKFVNEVRRVRPIVHSFLPQSYVLGSSLALMQGAAACVMSRRSCNHYQSRHPLAGWVERKLHLRMDALIGNSRAVVQDLLGEGAPPDRVGLIYNGVDPGRFPVGDAKLARRNTLRVQLGLPDDRVVLACVANLYPYKGHADLLDALTMLRAGLAARTTLLLVGRDAGARAALEAQSLRLGLSDCVRFLGECGDVPDLLAASDIGVLASHEEGFSNAVLEGMAAALPMVVTDVGGNAEAVTDGECGYVVPPHAPQALATALSSLIGDAGRRKAMGESARRRVAASFSLDACVTAYEVLYQELWDHRVNAEL